MRVELMTFPTPFAQMAPTEQRTETDRAKQNGGSLEDMAEERYGAVTRAVSDRTAS